MQGCYSHLCSWYHRARQHRSSSRDLAQTGTNSISKQGTFVGAPLVAQLKKGLGGDLATEGVNYAAGVGTNMGPGGADPKGVSEGERLFKLAASKCPNTIIVGGGYSQGAAVMHGAAKNLPANVISRIAGIALFGDTQNKQSGGHIKGLPESKSKVFCIQGDGVCGGALAVNGQHMAYPNSPKLKEGAEWLLANIKGKVSKAFCSGTTVC
jgi:cutinase